MKKSILNTVSILASLILLSTGSVIANNTNNISLSADTIEYNSNTDIAKAEGNVNITQDGGVLTGNIATYNLKDKKIIIDGNIRANKGDMTLTANSLESYNNELSAKGNVLFKKGDNTLAGSLIIYNEKNKDISMPKGGTAKGPDAEISGDNIFGNLNSNTYNILGNVYLYNKVNDFKARSNKASYIGNGTNFTFNATGNVNISSPSRNINSTSDVADYKSTNNGELILRGNAVVHQNNNTIKGNKLTIYLGNNITIK